MALHRILESNDVLKSSESAVNEGEIWLDRPSKMPSLWQREKQRTHQNLAKDKLTATK